MFVSCNQKEVVLQNECGYPQVIIGDWSSGSLELKENAGVVFRRLTARQQDADGGLREQPVQQYLVPALLRASEKASLDFAEHNKRDPDFFTRS